MAIYVPDNIDSTLDSKPKCTSLFDYNLSEPQSNPNRINLKEKFGKLFVKR